MRTRLVRVGWVALVLFACLPLLAAHAAKSNPKAETPDPVQIASPEWPSAELTLGIQARDSETEGMGDVLIPIWNPGGNGLLFINPRTAVTDTIDTVTATLTATPSVAEGNAITYTVTLNAPAQSPVSVTLANGEAPKP